MSEQNISLHCTTGGSDKVYHVQLKASPCGAGWLVLAQSGARNGRLNGQDKVTVPAPYATALKAYQTLVKKKVNKGYEIIDGTADTSLATPVIRKASAALRPKLSNAVSSDEMQALLCDDSWYLQQKYDGVRLMVSHDPGTDPQGFNRRGVLTEYPRSICDAVASLGFPCVLDGELVGQHYFVFDVLVFGSDVRTLSFAQRQQYVGAVLGALSPEHRRHFPAVKAYTTEGDKRAALSRFELTLAEGVVFHRSDAPYSEGRPNSGGTSLKFKFYETASCVVSKINEGKRSVALQLVQDDGELIDVGNVTIPPNKAVPEAGCVVEVRYLYAYPNKGSLFQPVYLMERSDVTVSECLYSQLKFKANDPVPLAA